MRRRLVAVICSMVAVGSLVATAAPASAATLLQDFDLLSNAGMRVALARGVIVNGTGMFTPTSPTSERIFFPGWAPITMTQTVTTHTEKVDPITCGTTVKEAGTFEFSGTQVSPNGDFIIFGGSGPFTHNAVRTGTRLSNGACARSSGSLQPTSLAARSTEIHAVA